MPHGPRYPGSLIVRVVINEYYALLRKYRKPTKQPGRLDALKQWFLRWEGMLFGGLVMSGLVAGAARIYQRERIDDIDRRVERREFYEGSCMMGAAHLAAVQNSLSFWEAMLLLSEQRIQQRQQWRLRQQQRTLIAAQQLQKWQARCGWLCGEVFLDSPQQQQQVQVEQQEPVQQHHHQQQQHEAKPPVRQQNQDPALAAASTFPPKQQLQPVVEQSVVQPQQRTLLTTLDMIEDHPQPQQQQQQQQQQVLQQTGMQQDQQQQGVLNDLLNQALAVLSRLQLMTGVMTVAADASSHSKSPHQQVTPKALVGDDESDDLKDGNMRAAACVESSQGQQQQQQQGKGSAQLQLSTPPQQHHHQADNQPQQPADVLHAMQQQWNPLCRYALYQLHQAQHELWQQQQLLVLMEVGQQLWEDMYKLGQQQVHLLKQQELQQQSLLLAHAGQLAVWQKLETRSSEALNLGFYLPDLQAALLRIQDATAAADRWFTGQQNPQQQYDEQHEVESVQQRLRETAVPSKQEQRWWQKWIWVRHRAYQSTADPGPTAAMASEQGRECDTPDKVWRNHVSVRLMLPIWVPDEVEERDFELTSREYSQRLSTITCNE